jgi:hypothetical protein
MNLVFRRPPYTPGAPLALVFGAVGGAELPLQVEGTVYFAALGVSGMALYDNRLPATVSTAFTSRHQAATPAEAAPVAPWGQPAPVDQASAGAWQSADRADAAPVAPWDTTERVDQPAGARWQGAAPVSQQRGMVYQACTPLDVLSAIGWQLATPATVNLLAPHQVADVLQQLRSASAQQATPADAVVRAAHQVATAAQRAIRARWQVAAQLIPPGLTVLVPPGEGGITPHVVSLDLVFACPPYEQGAPLDLVFGHVCLPPVAPSAPFFILPARFYMAVHSLQAWRLPDMLELPVLEFGYSADQGSFGWSFDLSLRPSAFDELAPTSGVPARVRVEVDGIRFEMVVDKLAKDEAHGRRSVKVSCISPTAILSAPFAGESQRLNAGPFTAQQLALQALEFTGVAIDWRLVDWLVPAGAWSHTGTPLGALAAIVGAAGGYLQSHRHLQQLVAMHPYPDLTGGILGGPWNWGLPGVVPDVELSPLSLVTTGIERADGPDLNAVYVSGVSQGVSGLYRRIGLGADKLPSPITDPLITAPEVVRQRGRAVIGAAGPKQRITATLPVLTGPSQPGILSVGQLIQVNESTPWRGMVRSVSGSFRHGAEVRQTLEIERHLGA